MKILKNFRILSAATGLAAILALSACAAPAQTGDVSDEVPDVTAQGDIRTLRVATRPTPHAGILRSIVPYLEVEGIFLYITEFTDFVTQNPALVGGDFDVNFFQHVPFMEAFMNDSGAELVHHAYVHIEPLGFHSTVVDYVSDVPSGAVIAIPVDVTNGARALNLLAYLGLLELHEDAGILATVHDITSNPLELEILPVDASILPVALQDTGFAVINVSIAMQAGLNPSENAIARETHVDSPYRNILVSRADNAGDPAIAALAYWLNSEIVREFILENYDGNIVPGF